MRKVVDKRNCQSSLIVFQLVHLLCLPQRRGGEELILKLYSGLISLTVVLADILIQNIGKYTAFTTFASL